MSKNLINVFALLAIFVNKSMKMINFDNATGENISLKLASNPWTSILIIGGSGLEQKYVIQTDIS